MSSSLRATESLVTTAPVTASSRITATITTEKMRSSDNCFSERALS
jgi:hypothetical protein